MHFDLRKQAPLLLSLLSAACSAALAQAPAAGTGSIRVFEPPYFTEFDPLTALDMVDRIPGVNAQESDGGRGLSGVRSNLLINGKRPPPKGKSASDQLRETPVASVVAIELIDAGARLDVDMQGYPQVINVVTLEDRPAYYEIITEVQRSGTGANDQQNERRTDLQGTGSFSFGGHEFTVAGNVNDQNNRSPADLIAIDPANPVQRISGVTTSDNRNEGIQFDGNFALPNESSLSFNSQFSTETRSSKPVDLVDDQSTTVNEGSDRQSDLRDFSTEYRRQLLSSGEILLAFVDTTSIEESESRFRTGGLSRLSFSNSETGETAARLRITNAPTDRLTVRTTVSNAFNYFEGGFRIFENGQEIIINGSNSRVEEDRRSLEGSIDWNLTSKWTFRSTLGVEAYEINTRDVASGLQTDPKGEIAVLFRPQPRTTFTLSTSRTVGQLSFNQFLASSSLSSEILTEGASELEPERERTVSASYDRRFGDLGVMRFSLARIETENPVDSVALSDSLIISQNVSPEIVDRLQMSVDFPFERFGHEDLILSVSGLFSDSHTIDPITGETREVSSGGGNFSGGGGGGNFSGGGGGNFSGGGRGGNFNGVFNGSFTGFTPRSLKQIELRKDPGGGKWSWSVSMRDIEPTGNYSVRQIRNSTGEHRWNASFTWEPVQGLKFRTNVDGPRTQTRESLYFGAVRAVGLDPTYVATNTTEQGTFTQFSVEWRRERLEITGTLASRPNNRTEEYLYPFGVTTPSFLAAESARTPRAMLRFRIIN
jgi:uncharacterized membrane protein YgcG